MENTQRESGLKPRPGLRLRGCTYCGGDQSYDPLDRAYVCMLCARAEYDILTKSLPLLRPREYDFTENEIQGSFEDRELILIEGLIDGSDAN